MIRQEDIYANGAPPNTQNQGIMLLNKRNKSNLVFLIFLHFLAHKAKGFDYLLIEQGASYAHGAPSPPPPSPQKNFHFYHFNLFALSGTWGQGIVLFTY